MSMMREPSGVEEERPTRMLKLPRQFLNIDLPDAPIEKLQPIINDTMQRLNALQCEWPWDKAGGIRFKLDEVRRYITLLENGRPTVVDGSVVEEADKHLPHES